MDITDVLSRLSGVRQNAPHRWMARCPAHEDKTASLSIRETQDGRILLHCFALCGAVDVVEAIGLKLGDLFPGSLPDMAPARRGLTAIDALRALTRESSIVAITAADIADGKHISPQDANRVCQAAGRIAAALDAIHGD